MKRRRIDRNEIAERIKSLPPGLTAVDAARLLGLKYCAGRHILNELGYKYRDGRGRYNPNVKVKSWDEVNWLKPDRIIAAELGVSRAWVNLKRKELRNGNRKSNSTKA